MPISLDNFRQVANSSWFDSRDIVVKGENPTARLGNLIFSSGKKTNDATRLAILADHDAVLSLGLLEHAAAKRAEDAKAKTAETADGFTVTGEGDAAIDALVLQRLEAKKARDFATADRIRDELKAQGVEVTDIKGGAIWKRVTA